MADITINALPSKTTWADTDVIIIQDGADTKKMTVGTFKGLLSSITGGQLKFPVAQIPSADVNTLDDYKEGSWSTVLTSDVGAPTFIGQYQRYTKIGNVVTIALSFQITNVGTASGVFRFTLPFVNSYKASGSGQIIDTGHSLSIISMESFTASIKRYDGANVIGLYTYCISMTYISA